MEPDQPPADDEILADEDFGGDDDGEVPEVASPKASKLASNQRAHKRVNEGSHDHHVSKKQRKKEQLESKFVDDVPISVEAGKTSPSVTKEERKSKKAERTLDGGIKIADHKLGSGPKAKRGDTVSVMYVGKLSNGKIFDSKTKGKPVRTLRRQEV